MLDGRSLLVDVRSLGEFNTGHLPKARSIPVWKCYPGAWPIVSRLIFLWCCIEAVHIIWPVWPTRNCIGLDLVTYRCSTRACQAGTQNQYPLSLKRRSAAQSSPGKLGMVTTAGEWCWCFRLTAYTLIAMLTPRSVESWCREIVVTDEYA